MKKGTAQMNSTSELDPTVNEGNQLDPRLKYDLSGKKPIVLIPQPSDDPDDPLVCLQRHPVILVISPDDHGADEAGDGRIGRWRREIPSPLFCVLCR